MTIKISPELEEKSNAVIGSATRLGIGIVQDTIRRTLELKPGLSLKEFAKILDDVDLEAAKLEAITDESNKS